MCKDDFSSSRTHKKKTGTEKPNTNVVISVVAKPAAIDFDKLSHYIDHRQ
jgi:hypothetical protein